MSPAERDHMSALALGALHKSCPLTPLADRVDPYAARAIALGYLQLAMLPSAIWDAPTEVPGVTIADAWTDVVGDEGATS